MARLEVTWAARIWNWRVAARAFIQSKTGMLRLKKAA